MKTFFRFFFLLSVCVGFASCVAEDLEENAGVLPAVADEISNVTVTLPELQISADWLVDEEGNASTRNQFYWDDKLKQVWADGDTLGIFPTMTGGKEGKQVEFPITEGIGTIQAEFNGGGWGLKGGVTYAAYYPYNIWNQFKTNTDLIMDYRGQTVVPVTSMKNPDALTYIGQYDYQASGSYAATSGSLNFELHRQSAIICLTFKPYTTTYYTQMELISSKGDIVTEAKLDVSGSTETSTPVTKTSSLVFDFPGESVNLSSSSTYYVFFELYPNNFATNNTSLKLRLKAKNGNYYTGTITAKDLVSNGTAVLSTGTMGRAPLTNLNLIAQAEARLGQPFVDKNSDGTVPMTKATNVNLCEQVKTLLLSGKDDPSIADELIYFPNLEHLNVSSNNLTSLDVSNNPKLKRLFANNNNLTSLDLKNNRELKSLTVSSNNLTSLDLKYNPKLDSLICYNNIDLASLDVTNCADLTVLETYYHSLSSIDLTYNTELIRLDIDGNNGHGKLNELYLTNNKKLEYLDARANNFTEIYGLEGCKSTLETLYLQNNTKLEKVDLDGFTALKTLNVENCTSMTNFYSYQSTNLQSFYYSGCTAVTDFSLDYSSKITSLDFSTLTNLKQLWAYGCGLTSIKLSNNTKLTYLNLHDNKLTSLDLSKNTALKQAYVYNNQLTSLTVKSSAMTVLSCYNNPSLTSLALSNVPNLTTLYCYKCNLSSLSLSSNTNLRTLYCYNNNLSSLSLTNNTKLTTLECYGNHMKTLNVTPCTSLTWDYLYCGKQTNATTGNYQYISVTGSDALYESLPDTGVPNSSSSSNSNYAVQYMNVYYPASI